MTILFCHRRRRCRRIHNNNKRTYIRDNGIRHNVYLRGGTNRSTKTCRVGDKQETQVCSKSALQQMSHHALTHCRSAGASGCSDFLIYVHVKNDVINLLNVLNMRDKTTSKILNKKEMQTKIAIKK